MLGKNCQIKDRNQHPEIILFLNSTWDKLSLIKVCERNLSAEQAMPLVTNYAWILEGQHKKKRSQLNHNLNENNY